MSLQISASQLAGVFNQCFSTSFRTQLCIGADEPFFVPANTAAAFTSGEQIVATDHARIFSRADYAASVLHEAAHWCIAGDARRKQLDYGYWYEPDGRSVEQQALFEDVEVHPQALERILSCASGLPFRLSADNASDTGVRPSESFRQRVHLQSLSYLREGLPERACMFARALDKATRNDGEYLKIGSYNLGDLI